jgi:hypothetical protein
MAWKFSAQQPIVDDQGRPTAEFLRALNQLFGRVGGGSMQPPTAPTGLAYAMDPAGVRLTCNENPSGEDVIAYQWRVGATWDTATVINSFGTTTEIWNNNAPGTYTAWVAAANVRGIYSAPSSISVTVTSTDLGIYGPDVTLTADHLAFVNLKNGGGTTPTSITLTASILNLPTPTYQWEVDGVIQVGATSSTFALPSFTSGSKQVRCDVTSGSLTAYDLFTIYAVNEGDDAVIAGLSNEDQSIVVDSGGTPIAGLPAGGTMTVARGAVVLGTGVTYAVKTATNCTATINATSGVYSVTAISADSASVTFEATVTATSTVLDRTMTLHKSYPGATGATGSTGTRGSRNIYPVSASYTSTYNDGSGAGAPSYKNTATTLIATVTAGTTPTTPIKGDTVTFTNGSNYVTTYTNDGTYATNGNNSWALPGTVLDGSVLVNGSVTATKINVVNLAALSANLGSVTAGNINGTANIDIAGSAQFEGNTTVTGTGTAVVANYTATSGAGLGQAVGLATFSSKASGTALTAQGVGNNAGGIYAESLGGYAASFNTTGSGAIPLSLQGWSSTSIGLQINNGTFKWGAYTYAMPAGSTSTFMRNDGTWANPISTLAKALVYQSVGTPGSTTIAGYLKVQSQDGLTGPVYIPFCNFP